MIITSKANELTMHSRLMGGDLQAWRGIHLEAEAPYLLVIYSAKEFGARVRQTCLVWEEKEWFSLCRQIEDDPNLDLIRVCLLSPPWMNRSNIWRIDAIKQILNMTHPVAGMRSCYVLENGSTLMDCRILPLPSDWETAAEIFSIDDYNCIPDFDSPHCVDIFSNGLLPPVKK